MSVTLEGKAAVVTGSGRGIGRATAHLLARLGASVVVNDIGAELDGSGGDDGLAAVVAAEIEAAGGTAVASHDTVSEFDAAGRIVGTALDHFGRVDILVNTAGLSKAVPIWELDPEEFERISASHIKGTFNCTRHAVGFMKDQGWGRIVNIVSRAGLQGVPGNAPYGTGKGGVYAFTNVVARDLAPFGITVNSVNPAATRTRLVTTVIDAGLKQGGERARIARNLEAALQPPEAVATMIAYLCSEQAAGVTGETFLVGQSEVGVFEPLTLGETATKEGIWTVDELAEAIPKLQLHELDEPY